jgi:3-phenylpropionate/cinnamic acid dioxygenase small subunit
VNLFHSNTEDLRNQVEAFLYEEAELLDQNDLGGWLRLLSPDLSYRLTMDTAPVQDGQESGGRQELCLDETYSSLKIRIERLATGHGWIAEPRPRSLRLVTNIRVAVAGETAAKVKSRVLVFFAHPRDASCDLLACQRNDRLCAVSNRLLLIERTAFIVSPLVLPRSLGLPL